MPILGIGLHVIIALFFAVHAARTGQDKYWLWLLFVFPGVGSLAYALAIWLPDARHSRQGRQVVRGVKNLIDPTRELRAAQEALDIAATPDNQIRLASALLDSGRASESVVQYQAAMKGIHARDPQLRVRLAHALLEAGKPADARTELETLIAEHPNFKSPEGHLCFARALADLGERDKSREEYEVLVGYYAGLEARARYAGQLLAWNDTARAASLAGEGLKLAARMPRHARDMNAPWLAQLKQIDAQLSKRTAP